MPPRRPGNSRKRSHRRGRGQSGRRLPLARHIVQQRWRRRTLSVAVIIALAVLVFADRSGCLLDPAVTGPQSSHRQANDTR